jgi:hypothetical protein
MIVLGSTPCASRSVAVRVPQIVKADRRQTGSLQQRVELARDVPRIQRRADEQLVRIRHCQRSEEHGVETKRTLWTVADGRLETLRLRVPGSIPRRLTP